MTQTERRLGVSSFRAWAKIALFTGVIIGALWILLLKAPFLFFNSDPLTTGIGWFLIFPGILLFAPAILQSVHGYWPGYIALGAVVNWLLYTELIYKLVGWRRRKGQN